MSNLRTFATMIFFALLPAAGASAQDGALTYSDFLHRMLDLKALPLPEDKVHVRQFSSYDRSGWTANRDWGNYLRSSGDEGNVLAEMQGPGCVLRIWSANPSGRIQFFLDGAETPALEASMPELFEGGIYPFFDPLAYRISGANAYVPIPFNRSCKVVLRDNKPLYYHIGYMTFPLGTEVETYTSAGAEAANETVTEALERLGDPGPQAVDLLYPEGLETVAIDVEAGPEETVELFNTEKPGTIALLELKATSRERHVLRKALLKIYWDGAPTPAVNCPLGDFFGTAFGENLYKAYPMGMTGNGGYCLFPMPFKKNAYLEIVNQGSQSVRITGRLVLAPLPAEGAPFTFHAGWRRENPNQTFDYPILKVQDKGKFLGCALFVDNPEQRWWGEGDEKIWVDGEDFPSFFGTGSEDYFGDAWGHRHHIKPFEGCTLSEDPKFGNKTCVYRYHVPDAVPFTVSFKMTMENYAKNIDYASVAWWYQENPGRNDFFYDVPVHLRIPSKPLAIGAIEAEDLEATSENGEAFAINDGDLPFELSQGKGLLLKGMGPFAVSFPVEKRGNYIVHLGFARYLEHPELILSAPAGVSVSAITIRSGRPGFLEDRPAGHVRLEEGNNTLYLTVLGKEGETLRTLLDYIRLKPMDRIPGATEAEDLFLLAVENGRARVEDFALPWSGGAQILFNTEQAAGRMNLELPVRFPGEYIIDGACTKGEDYGEFTLLMDKKVLGEIDPSALEGEATGRFTLGPIYLSAGDRVLTVATLTKAGLDYIDLSWSLTGEHALEGESLKVLIAEKGKWLFQGLDRKQFSNGKHLWFRGEEKGAYIEVEIPVAADGEYNLLAFFVKSWDYGIVSVLLNDESIGDDFDGYSPETTSSGPVDLGTHALQAGKHKLTFVLDAKHERSSGFFMGLDGLVIKPR